MPALISTNLSTPIGPMVAAANDAGLCFLEFGGEARLRRQVGPLERFFGKLESGNHPTLDQARTELAAYFAGRLTEFTVPLVIRGTPFQESVWRALLAIPYGETRAYSDLAESLGKPGAQRAVGLANGQNRLAVIVPCHRVIERSGGLRGYGGGLHVKKFLLDLERRVAGAELATTPLGRAARTGA